MAETSAFGKALRDARLAAGMTQKALADAVGGKFRQQYIGQVENGERSGFSAENVARIERALGLNPGELSSLLPGEHAAHIAGTASYTVIGVVSAGDGAGEVFDPPEVLKVNGLWPVGTVAYLVRGTSMVDENIQDGDYILVRPQPVARPGEVVVVYVPDMGTLVKIKRKDHYASRDRKRKDDPARTPIPFSDGCHEYGVLVGVIRKC